MWLFDKLMNRKIEGKSSLDNVEPLLEKVVVDVYDDEGYDIELPDNVSVEGERLSIQSYTREGQDSVHAHIDHGEATFKRVSGSAVDITRLTSGGLYHSYVDEDDNNPINNVIDISDNGDVGGAYISVLDVVSNKSTHLFPAEIDVTGENPFFTLSDGENYVSISKSSIDIGNDDSEFSINIELNDPVYNGFNISQSRNSAIANIPQLVDSVYDFGEQSTGIQVSLAGRGKYTFTELKGSNIGESSINITIVLPSFVKEIIRLGSDSSSIMEESINTPTVRIPLPAHFSVDQRGEATLNISVLITDYIAYVRYDDNY